MTTIARPEVAPAEAQVTDHRGRTTRSGQVESRFGGRGAADADRRQHDPSTGMKLLPDPLLSAFLPLQYARVRQGDLARSPRDLVIDRIRDVLRSYSAAVTPV